MIVFKFVEHPENNEKPMDQKSRVKFKIMSLKVNGPMDYVPELVGLQTLFRFAPVSFHFFFFLFCLATLECAQVLFYLAVTAKNSGIHALVQMI